MIFAAIDLPTLGIARTPAASRPPQVGGIAADRARGLLVGARLERIVGDDRQQVRVLQEQRSTSSFVRGTTECLRRGRRGAAAGPSACAGGSRPGPRPPSAGPSITSSVISWPRWAGRQCSTTTSSAARSTSLLVELVGREHQRALVGLGLLAHARPHVRVQHVGASVAAVAASFVTRTAPAGLAPRSPRPRCTTCGIGSNPGGVATARSSRPSRPPAAASAPRCCRHRGR